MITRQDILKRGGALALAVAAPLPLYRGMTAAAPVTLDFWNWWNGPRKPLMDQLIGRFQAQHPTIQVKNDLKTYDHRAEQVLTALISPNPPAVLMALRTEIPTFADQGTIIPIDSYVKASGVDVRKFYPSQVGSMYQRGQLYSLPMPTGGEYSMMLYNTDLFRKAGLNPARPPRTWQELTAAGAALTKRGSGGKIVQGGINLLYSGIGYQFLPNLYCNNGSLYSSDLKKVAFYSPEGIQTLQFMVDLIRSQYGSMEHYLDFVNTTDDDSLPQHPWHQGRLGMFPVGYWVFYETQQLAPKLRYDVTLRAYNGANPKAKTQGPVTGGWGYVIPKGLSPETEQAAFQFVKFLTYDMQGGCQFMQAQGRPSPLTACNNSPIYFSSNPHWSQVQQAVAHDVTIPVLSPHDQIVAQFDTHLQGAFYGSKTAKQALSDAADAAQPILDRYWNSHH